MIVPPRGSRPEISRGPSGSNSPSTSPFQPSWMPTSSWPRSMTRRPTARMTAFSPGQSPPPVRTPTRIRRILRAVLRLDREDLEARALRRFGGEPLGLRLAREAGDESLIATAWGLLRPDPGVALAVRLVDDALEVGDRPAGSEDGLELADFLGLHALDGGRQPDAASLRLDADRDVVGIEHEEGRLPQLGRVAHGLHELEAHGRHLAWDTAGGGV